MSFSSCYLWTCSGKEQYLKKHTHSLQDTWSIRIGIYLWPFGIFVMVEDEKNIGEDSNVKSRNFPAENEENNSGKSKSE